MGADATGAAIEADLTLEGSGWYGGNFPQVQDAESIGGFGVYKPYALGAGSGCSDDLVTTDLGESPYALAQRLAELPGSTVVQPVKPSEVLGQYALHLRLRIPQTCPAPEYYRVAETPRGGRGITRDRPDKTFPPVVIDFWVTEWTGIPLVVDSWHQAGASGEMIGRIAAARDSLTFVPGP